MSLWSWLKRLLPASWTEPPRHKRRVEPRPASEKPPGAGPHEILVVDSLWLRGRREHQLEVRLTFPAEPGVYPLIVFSHGASASKDDYRVLTHYWASHGYICVQPSHSDANPLAREGAAAHDFSNWAKRPCDIVLILDAIRELESRVAGLRRRIDRKNIGIGGHSFGAGTAQLVAGATIKGRGQRRRTFADRRTRSLLMISPPGLSRMHDEYAWSGLHMPMMSITGTRDRGRDGQDYRWRLGPFEYAPAGYKYLMVIDGALHDMGGLALAPPQHPKLREEGHARLVMKMSLYFWNATLKGDASSLAQLEPRRLRTRSGDTATLSAK